MARIWINGAPTFRVSLPGYDAANLGTASQYLSFDASRIGNGTLFLAGHVSESTVAANGGLIVSYPDFGYVPITRVLAKAGYSEGKITNILIDGIITFSTGISRALIISGPTQKITDYYYFVFTSRVN